MKNKLVRFFALLCIAAAGFMSGCVRDECTSSRTFIRFEPVYKSLAECRAGITPQAPRDLKNPGKIYAFGDYLFINEKQEGIHVVNNADSAHPQNIAFWNIPGNVDIAIRGQHLYADQYIDLLTIDISNLQNPQLVCRNENVFTLLGVDPINGVLIEYKETEITEKISCDDSNWNSPWFWRGGIYYYAEDLYLKGGQVISSGSPVNAGIAGSYARFGLYDQYLYTVDQYVMRTWSVSGPCAVRLDSVYVSWNVESIFPWKNKLFLGSQTGVFVFDNSNPARPVQEALFSHASGCDPVVCDDKFAYVTIHDGTTCNGTFNQLDVIGIENLPSADLLKSYPMTKPFGLAVTNDHLFLCDDGLKIYDKSKPLEMKELSHMKDLATYDVIALSDSHLLLVGDDGFYQFDVSDPASPKQLSLLPVVK